jgi:hypothetical protein
MNPDPLYERLRQTGWRRELTDAEQAELRAHLARHPEARADWQLEASLNAGLRRLPDAPVSSNFTARVLQAVALEAAARARRRPERWTPAWWWRVMIPRAAVAALLLGAGWFGHERIKVEKYKGIANGLAVVAVVTVPPNPEVLEDFEAIRRLNPGTTADEELLALNEELLALMP